MAEAPRPARVRVSARCHRAGLAEKGRAVGSRRKVRAQAGGTPHPTPSSGRSTRSAARSPSRAPGELTHPISGAAPAAAPTGPLAFAVRPLGSCSPRGSTCGGPSAPGSAPAPLHSAGCAASLLVSGPPPGAGGREGGGWAAGGWAAALGRSRRCLPPAPYVTSWPPGRRRRRPPGAGGAAACAELPHTPPHAAAQSPLLPAAPSSPGSTPHPRAPCQAWHCASGGMSRLLLDLKSQLAGTFLATLSLQMREPKPLREEK